MRNGWIVIAFVAGALLGAVGGAALVGATRGQATLMSYELAPEGQQEIRVLVGVGRLHSFNFVDVQEDANAVRISVDVLHWRGLVPADMKLLYVPVPLQQPLGTRNVLDGAGQPIPLRRRVAAPAQTASPTASPTAAPTPPRTTRASWVGERATVSDVIARFRTAGLNVEAQPPTNYVIFGADRVDQFWVQGEVVAIYAFPTAAASARVLDDAANSRLTVLYLLPPYYVQVANLLVVITTNDPTVAAAAIDALTR